MEAEIFFMAIQNGLGRGQFFSKSRMCQYLGMFCYIIWIQKCIFDACRLSLHNSTPSHCTSRPTERDGSIYAQSRVAQEYSTQLTRPRTGGKETLRKLKTLDEVYFILGFCSAVHRTERQPKQTRSSAVAESARRFVSLNILLSQSHSRSPKIIQNDTVE